MDNLDRTGWGAPLTHREWSASPTQAVIEAVGGCLFLLLTLAAALDLVEWSGLDAGGTILLGGVALVFLAVAAADGLLRPRLAAHDAGVTVRTLTGRHTVPWSEVTVRAIERRRFGRATHTLEIDDGERLIVLGRRELGADPRAVAGEIAELRTAPPA